MYAAYKRESVDPTTSHYVFEEQVKLFGTNDGFVTWLLEPKLPKGQAEPFLWHLDIRADMDSSAEYKGYSLLIDLKPKQHKTNVSLYELMDVWGYSENGWTPVLLRLNGLFVDAEPSEVDRNDFSLKHSRVDGPIYEFLYLSGSVHAGKLDGTWAPPPASPTNAALLWPKPLRYFYDCIRSCTPGVLGGT